MKKIKDQNINLADPNQKTSGGKNSLFEDSFFDDDEDDDDFDFDDDDSSSAAEKNEERNIPVQNNVATKNHVQQTPIQQISPSVPLQSNEQSLAQEIQFRLGCELGQVLIPYENLQNLSIGSVVDFNNTLQTLYLSVNNVRVGEGMLVDVDGKIGIKITRWYGRV